MRAKFVAENFLDAPKCYNSVRGMLGYTGTYKGTPVSVQGTGMGIPSHLIYIHELMETYECKRLIRIGSCGSIQPHIGVSEVIIAMSASTTSGINRRRFRGCDYAACASYPLLATAMEKAKAQGTNVHVGNILSEDEFYGDNPDHWKLWAQFGVLALEMETSGLYTEAARLGAEALSILTVSDMVAGNSNHAKDLNPEEREKSFTSMMKIALETAAS